MNDFWKLQFEMAARMIKMMELEHADRIKNFDLYMETSRSLIQKLADRDEKIATMHAQISELQDRVNRLSAGK